MICSPVLKHILGVRSCNHTFLVHTWGQVLQSHIFGFHLFQLPAHCRIVHAHMVRNLPQSVPVALIGLQQPPPPLPASPHQLLQARPPGLRLPPWDLPDHFIRLMFGHKRLAPQIDLSGQLRPGTGRIPPLGHKLSIACLSRSYAPPKLPEEPVDGQKRRGGDLIQGTPYGIP